MLLKLPAFCNNKMVDMQLVIYKPESLDDVL